MKPAISEARGGAGSRGGVAYEPKPTKKEMKVRRRPRGESTEANLAWPPTKEDLERLYVNEQLSAMKISKCYGLRYPNPKSGEAMILHYLKKRGIKRRDPADHIRKVTEEMEDEWVRRYKGGQSLHDIAAGGFSPVTVLLHLRKRGVELRDKVEAQIQAVTKHAKKPFNEDPNLRAYLIGIAKGDFWITNHGRAIRARLGTTHPGMAKLFRELFEPYGPIYEYPKRTPLTGFEWSLDCDLDSSFKFLANSRELLSDIFSSKDLFLSFLAGFFDAEGSVYYHKKAGIGAFEFSLANTDVEILEMIRGGLRELGLSPNLREQRRILRRTIRGTNIISTKPIWRLELWRHEDVARILKQLPLRHPEKVAKAEIALSLRFRSEPGERESIISKWESLKCQIERDVDDYIEKARRIPDTVPQ